MKFLYKNFLEDKRTYAQNAAYIARLVSKTTGIDTPPYYKTQFKNETPFLDGNPIFSTKKQNRILRIIQEKPESHQPVIDAYIQSKNSKTKELVIHIELSKEILDTLKTYVKAWMVDNWSVKKMNTLIAPAKNLYAQKKLQPSLAHEPPTKYKVKKKKK